MIELRPMVVDDLELVAAWLREPHVARWWLAGTTAAEELDGIREHVAGRADAATRMMMVLERSEGAGSSPVGWCQWYPFDAYPAEAAAAGALTGECGFDYAIGDPAAVGRGLGTELIAQLIEEVRRAEPGCGFVVSPDARNRPSRRVLERNGFQLVQVRPIETDLTDDPMAIYRLSAVEDG